MVVRLVMEYVAIFSYFFFQISLTYFFVLNQELSDKRVQIDHFTISNLKNKINKKI